MPHVEKSTHGILVGPVSSRNCLVNDSDVWGILGVVVGEISTPKKRNFQHVKEIVRDNPCLRSRLIEETPVCMTVDLEADVPRLSFDGQRQRRTSRFHSGQRFNTSKQPLIKLSPTPFVDRRWNGVLRPSTNDRCGSRGRLCTGEASSFLAGQQPPATRATGQIR